MMRFFLERGGDFQRADAFGVTPLHVAAALDYEEMLQFLLERGGAFMCVYQGSEKFRTVCTISEIKSTKAVTEAVPFQKSTFTEAVPFTKILSSTTFFILENSNKYLLSSNSAY